MRSTPLQSRIEARVKADLELAVLTPAGETARIPCDSVRIFVKDNAAGEGGGSMGIRKGRLPAVAALEEGSVVSARLSGEQVFSMRVSGGFALVKDNVVTVLTDTVREGEDEQDT